MQAEPGSIHEMQSEVFKAIGHPIRLRIVKFLADGEHPVHDIVRAVGAEQSNVSRHLSLLKQAGVLANRKAGLQVYYRVNSPEMVKALGCVFTCVEAMARTRAQAGGSAGG